MTADGQDSIFVQNVQFDVSVVAFAVPRVLAGFSHSSRAPYLGLRCERAFADLRPLGEQHLGPLGEFGESENVLFVSLPSPSIVWALAPAVEASFHCAASAFRVVKGPGSGPSTWALSQVSGASR